MHFLKLLKKLLKNFMVPITALQAATILVAMVSRKNIW